MRNKVIILSLSLIMVLCSSFSVFAITRIDVTMNEPTTSDTQGYLVVTNPSKVSINVFYWSITPYKATENLNNVSIPSMSLVLNDDSITFTALHTGNARVTLTRVNNSTTQIVCMSEQFTTSASYTYTGMDDIEYYCYGGNVGVVDDNISSTNNYLTVNWGTSTYYQEEFDELINELGDIDTRLMNISSSVDGLEGKLDTINTTLTRIRDYVDTLETKLNTLNGTVTDVLEELTVCRGYLLYIAERLDDIYPLIQSIDTNVEDIEDYVINIMNTLYYLVEIYGEESTEPLPDDDLTDLEDAEDDVITDESDKLDDLSLSFGNAFDVVWKLISDAWQTNAKVFTVVIMCLTIGVLKLILNR